MRACAVLALAFTVANASEVGVCLCDDPDCVRTPAQRRRCATEHGQQCWDGFDNDRDGKVDCEDTDCQKTTGQRKRCAKMAATETGRECLDYIDNDGDGTTDCADTDCTANKKFKKRCDTWAASVAMHKDENPNTETGKECMDHIDNDGDGHTDCKDSNCLRDRRIKQRCEIMIKRNKPGYDNPRTETGRECHDGIDNDHDGQIDCQDSDCLKNKNFRRRCQVRAGGGH